MADRARPYRIIEEIKNPTVNAVSNSSFERKEQVEPDRLLSTPSKGLSAIIEIEAPCLINYGSRTCVTITSMGRVN